MESYQSTTPFGRRPLTLAQVASQAIAKARPPEKAVNKWTVFRTICTAKDRIGVTERALAVLDALLSFHPETVLAGENLVVWPSNQQLALRAHGMAPATLRRNLAILVDAGLIVRRDSPNGKRYARKGRGGEIELAFGFDLGLLVARAEEFEAWAGEVEAEARALKLVRERLTLCRRDIAKMIATGIEENIPTQRDGTGPADWSEVYVFYRATVARISRSATRIELEPIAQDLSALAEELLNVLETHVESRDSSANESQDERHKQNSNPHTSHDSEPGFRESEGEPAEPDRKTPSPPLKAYPLGLVMQACPDIADYARSGIANWRDLLATASVVRPMLGISPSAWEEACAVMGEGEAAVVVAAILQRAAEITSPGGYLRALTRKARAGEFSLGPVLMALIGRKTRANLALASTESAGERRSG